MTPIIKIAIASGKGGTGKTTVAVNLAAMLAKKRKITPVQLLDCDVEEPNAHLFLKPEIVNTQEVGILVPKIDKNICDGCGTCSQMCKFNALAVVKKQVLLFEQLCHGCGVCTYFCPLKAIYEEKRTIGVIEQGKAGDIQFSAGCLDIGEPMATPIIKALKKNIINNGIAILDAAPGTSCPAVEAISGCHFCLLVTEPTPFGLHDLKLAVAMCRQLEVPAAVVLNRSDLGDNSVEKFCEKENLPILLKIPFNREIAMAYSEGKMLLESVPGFAANIERLIEGIWARLKEKEENSVFPSDPKDKFWQAGVGI